VFATILAAGVLDQDPAHRLRGCCEEVIMAVPLRPGTLADEPEIRLVHQIGKLEALPRVLAGELPGGESAQFLVDQRQDLLCGLHVAPLDRRRDVREVAHRGESSGGSNLAASTRPRAPSLGSPTSPGRADGVAP
jgi:hypothetical protein